MNISILGCGWLGFPAGTFWSGKGHRIHGSTTSQEYRQKLESAGITSAVIQLNESGISSDAPDSFWESDVMLVNIPPGRSRGDVRKRHPREIRHLIDHLQTTSIPWIIFASSTSVYGPTGGWKRETDAGQEPASSQSGEALLECEQMLQASDAFDCTIIRFGGLYGYDRHPAKNLSGRKNLKGGSKPINLIHRDDAIQILDRVITLNLRNEIFNAVSDEHPARKEFYQAMADRMGLARPTFLDEDLSGEGYKKISNRKLKERLEIELIYPDPSVPSP